MDEALGIMNGQSGADCVWKSALVTGSRQSAYPSSGENARIKKGVTYSRPTTGTGMPSLERFQAHPIGRAFKRHPVSRKCQFRSGQRPKLANLLFVGWSIGLHTPSFQKIVTVHPMHGNGDVWSSAFKRYLDKDRVNAVLRT